MHFTFPFSLLACSLASCDLELNYQFVLKPSALSVIIFVRRICKSDFSSNHSEFFKHDVA